MSSEVLDRRTGVLPVDRAATVVLARGDVELARWPLATRVPLDLFLVDELARLQLAARRVGYSIRLCDTCGELSDLLAFVGLAEGLVAGAALEVVGEAEEAEERRVEEVVVPDDPVA